MCIAGPQTGTDKATGQQMYLPMGMNTVQAMKMPSVASKYRSQFGDDVSKYEALYGYDPHVLKTLAKTEGRKYDPNNPFGLNLGPTEAELKGQVTVTQLAEPPAAAVQNTPQPTTNNPASKLLTPKKSSPLKPIKQAATGTSLSGASGLNVPT